MFLISHRINALRFNHLIFPKVVIFMLSGIW